MIGLSIEMTYTWSSPKSSCSWNPADFIRISWNPYEIQWISYRFHEIRQISWNLVDFIWISWNPADFIWISYGFHEIWWISPMKSGGFHEIHEIQWISHRYHCDIKNYKASVSANTLQFDECRVGANDQGFHEIHQISPWNLVDFTHEIWQISPRFHLWNPPNYKSKCFQQKLFSLMNAGWGISPLKSSGFHPEIWWIFTHEIWQISPRFHLWNPPKIIKASVSAKTLQFDECRVGDFTPEIWWISPVKSGRFHPDFTCEIHPKL